MQQLHRDPRLIYDVGMYDGSDTRYYLDSGYKVLAVEANPELVARAHRRFRKEIGAGQLVVVHAAIGCAAGQTVELITAQDDLGSSSVIPQMVAAMGPGRTFAVQTTTLHDLFGRYGIPHFLKADIEGADRDCVLLLDRENRPTYLSFEANDDVEELVEHAASCGYEKFKAINQTTFLSVQKQYAFQHRLARKIIRTLGYDEPNVRRINGRRFVLGHSSGPVPWESCGPWIGKETVLALWKREKAKGMHIVWYDIHATVR